MASSSQSKAGSNGSAPPPTPQEITRKLSMHSKPAKIQPTNVANPPPLSGTESDSDTFFSPEHSPLATSHSAGSQPWPIPSSHGQTQNQNQSMSLGFSASVSSKPLSSIAERRSGSGDEESDEEGDDDWPQDQEEAQALRSRKPDGDSVIKTGYLYKKGVRRKTWKKRWFVLRPAHLAFYKNSAEYQLLKIVELADVHSCSPVELKRHPNSLVLVSPTRTFYLQADSEQEMLDWVQHINEARETILGTSTQNSATATPIAIPAASGSRQSNTFAQSPSASAGTGAQTPSPPSARSIGFAGPVTSDSESDDQAQGEVSKSTVSNASPSKPQASGSTTRDPIKIILSGYLMKSRSKRRGWRKRWFVLTSDALFYSASHMDTKHRRRIELSQVIDALEYELSNDKSYSGTSTSISPPAVRESDDSHGYGQEGDPANAGFIGAQYTFKIVTTKRPLLLCAPSEAEEIKWLSAVRALIARRSNPPGAPGTSYQQVTIGSGNAEGGGISGAKTSLSVGVRKRSASGASGLVIGKDEPSHN